jgi:hypothetical protein
MWVPQTRERGCASSAQLDSLTTAHHAQHDIYTQLDIRPTACPESHFTKTKGSSSLFRTNHLQKVTTSRYRKCSNCCSPCSVHTSHHLRTHSQRVFPCRVSIFPVERTLRTFFILSAHLIFVRLSLLHKHCGDVSLHGRTCALNVKTVSVSPMTSPRIRPNNINTVSRQAVSADQYPANMSS